MQSRVPAFASSLVGTHLPPPDKPEFERSPPVDGPNNGPTRWLPEKGHILGDEQQTERQHPDAKTWQDGEDATEDQQDTGG